MTRQDYERIATILKDTKPKGDWSLLEKSDPAFTLWDDIVTKFAMDLARHNPKFQAARFYHACGCHPPGCNCA